MSICDNCQANTVCSNQDVADPENMVGCVGYIPPERTCHWEWCVYGSGQDTYEAWNCSTCGEVGDALDEPPAYCPYCGSKIEGDF